MNKTILGIALLTTGLAGVAVAQPQGPGPMADPFGDKTVTKAEMQAHAGEMFAKMDSNKDGKLDQADRAAHKAQMHARMFDMIDANKDGNISRAEFDAAHQKMGGGDGMKGMRGQHDGMGMGQGMGKGAKMMMRMADTNKDGAVSRDEFLAGHAMMFDHADTNKDGKLTPEERKAHHAAMRQHMGKRGERGPGAAGDHSGHGQHGAMAPATKPAS